MEVAKLTCCLGNLVTGADHLITSSFQAIVLRNLSHSELVLFV